MTQRSRDQSIGYQLSSRIIQLARHIEQHLSELIIETIPAYQSLTLCYQPLAINEERLIREITRLLNSDLPQLEYQPRLVKIPVCYDTEYAPDLAFVAEHCKLSAKAVVEYHSNTLYCVHMLGFLPGFLYLGGLNPQLNCPRKAIPSIQIPAGSVAIGANQTGVYPVNSPGGWQIIGRTPLKLFSPEATPHFIASPLDQVKFTPITKAKYDQLLETD